MNANLELFDPQPADCPRLAAQHLAWAAKHNRAAERLFVLGMAALARWETDTAAVHEAAAVELAMLGEFYALAGLE